MFYHSSHQRSHKNNIIVFSPLTDWSDYFKWLSNPDRIWLFTCPQLETVKHSNLWFVLSCYWHHQSGKLSFWYPMGLGCPCVENFEPIFSQLFQFIGRKEHLIGACESWSSGESETAWVWFLTNLMDAFNQSAWASRPICLFCYAG